nr:hypothetical protein [Candidatus Gracilibacteria bacterium]
MGKNIVVFCGSQEINNTELKNEVIKQFEGFLKANKDKINSILYGGGTTGVMGLVFDTATKVGITIKGYSLEKYRKYDEGNGVDLEFFSDDYSRVSSFERNGDVFLTLPGGEGTIREVGFVADMISGDSDKKVYISSLFEVYVEMLKKLDSEGMLYPKDKERKQIVRDLSELII